jgi:hypothetical protein
MEITRIVAACLLLCAALCQLAAQNPTATLVGTVKDPTGSLVPTNEIRKALTDQRGEFTVPNLAPGIYDVDVSKPGFRFLHEAGLGCSWNNRLAWSFVWISVRWPRRSRSGLPLR